MAKNTTTICILDDDPERCLREEKTLDLLIAEKKLPVNGIANFGINYIARSGMEGKLPAIEVDGVYFHANPGQELTYDRLGRFLDMLVEKEIIGGPLE